MIGFYKNSSKQLLNHFLQGNKKKMVRIQMEENV